MATLEKVMNMKNQGIAESEIIKSLQDQGISPKEISDALSQSKIKQAVFAETGDQGMQPSIMENAENQNMTPSPQGAQSNDEEVYQPQMPQNNEEALYSPNQNYGNQAAETEEYYPQESYQSDSYSESNIDNMIEIAEQVFQDKIKKMQTQFNELIEFKTISESKIENMSERLKRMEKMFDQMQISIINKVGNFGKGLDTLKKEIEMVEDSFSKVIDKKVHKKTSSKTTHKKSSKKKK